MERDALSRRARDVITWCRSLAECSEEPGVTTRTFLSAPMRDVHARLRTWMESLGMRVQVDAAGNLRGVHPALQASAPQLFLGSHLDTVPHAGAFDGILGVVLAVALVDRLGGRRLPFSIEVVGFSEEEGVRFGVPFIGSRALAGSVDEALLTRQDATGATVADAIRDYGLDPLRINDARADGALAGYLEFHIEQGPVLDRLGLPLGVVEVIKGQSRVDVQVTGAANHAGTTPMDARHDALAGAAAWILAVEEDARTTPGLVATVGRLEVRPNATNVIAGTCSASLDVRHADDEIRVIAVGRLLDCARAVAAGRGLSVTCETRLDQPAVVMDPAMTDRLARAVQRCGLPVHRMPSGAGHDAMTVSTRMPSALLFLRSPGGVSHDPDEAVLAEDVASALEVGARFIEDLAEQYA
ncbi:MAG: allantoate amidohydrolase [Acidobacteriota bacterium]